MGFFDYEGGDGRALIGDAYMLAAYSAQPYSVDLNNGWEELSRSDLGTSSRYYSNGFFTDDGSLSGGQAKVLVQRDGFGRIEKLAISFAATNSLGDIGDYGAMYAGTYDNAFDYLFDAVRDYAEDRGLNGSDVIITGYSLGGGATNNAEAGRLSNAGGFFADSDYMGFASPLIETGNSLFNFGFENDAVFRLDSGNSTSTDNLVLYDSTYASNSFTGGINLFSPGGWDAHLEGISDHDEIFSAIADSNFYDLMERDSLVIVSNLSGSTRSNTWVEPENRGTGNHVGDDAFILGTSGGDMLRGSSGDDFLDGYAGNDELVGGSGNDWLEGGSGNDELTGGSGDDTFWFNQGFGDDTITDFDADDDVIAFDSGIFDSFADVMANAEESGGSGGGWWWWWGGGSSSDVTIEYGSHSVTIENVELDDLSASNFIFT